MKFDLPAAVLVLRRTPDTLDAWLRGLPTDWTDRNEGDGTWSPFDVVGHLVHGEEADWIPRARLILEHGDERAFDPFDRFAQFEKSKDRSLDELLDEFRELRARSLKELEDMRLGPSDWARTGTHPELGPVTLGQLLATWVVHDLAHIQQIARVMAKQYKEEVGAWRKYIPVLQR